MKVGSILKKTAARLLFFGFGFGLSYLVTRPTAVEIRPYVDCGDSVPHKGEFQVNPNGDGCSPDGDSKIKVTTPDPVRSFQEPLLTFPV